MQVSSQCGSKVIRGCSASIVLIDASYLGENWWGGDASIKMALSKVLSTLRKVLND